MKKKLKLRKWVYVVLTLLGIVLVQLGIKSITTTYDNFYEECDNYYGYPVDYYTCRLYHIQIKNKNN